MIDKIIERLEEYKQAFPADYDDYYRGVNTAIGCCIDIVKQVAEEGSWIKCSDRMPDKWGDYLTTRKIEYITMGVKVMEILHWDEKKWSENAISNLSINGVVAWQPLPKSFKESD